MARRAHCGRHPHLGESQFAAAEPGIFRREPPGRNRVPADQRYHDNRTGRRDHRVGRAAQCRSRRRRHGLFILTCPQARGGPAHNDPAHHSTDRVPRTKTAKGIARKSRSHRRCRRDGFRNARRDAHCAGVWAGATRGRAVRQKRRNHFRGIQKTHPASRSDDRNRHGIDIRRNHPGDVARGNRCC